jgi:hypothetical protein
LPKILPGTTATLCSRTRYLAKSQELNPQPDMFGNA